MIEGSDHQEVAIRTREWLYREVNPEIRTREKLLREIGFEPEIPVQRFDLNRGPEERKNVGGHPEHAEVVERLHGLVAEVAGSSSPVRRKLDSEEHIRGLKALGYLN